MSAQQAKPVLGKGGKGTTRPGAPMRRPGLVLLFAVLVATNLATLGALYFAPEISALLEDDSSELFTAYERRIVELRLEVDRLYSRQYAQAGDLNLQLHELTQQQDLLAEQHAYIRTLADQARSLGIDAASVPSGTDPFVTGAIAPVGTGPDAIGALTQSVYTMQDESRLALMALSDAATESTEEIVGALSAIGLRPAAGDTAMGGPFLPAADDLDASSIASEANAVAAALHRFEMARNAIVAAPIRQPVPGAPQTTSNFGNRTDPFLGRLAFHAGMDFRAATGTTVLAAAAGTVIAAGANGGYGNAVDIDHGNGLVTRYAHMSAIAVAVGNRVEPGAVIGYSGSTGRSTGPHLHFEVRRNDVAVNPADYLRVGRTLAAYL